MVKCTVTHQGNRRNLARELGAVLRQALPGILVSKGWQQHQALAEGLTPKQISIHVAELGPDDIMDPDIRIEVETIHYHDIASRKEEIPGLIFQGLIEAGLETVSIEVWLRLSAGHAHVFAPVPAKELVQA